MSFGRPCMTIGGGLEEEFVLESCCSLSTSFSFCFDSAVLSLASLTKGWNLFEVAGLTYLVCRFCVLPCFFFCG